MKSIGVRCLHSETVTYEVLGESCFHRPAYPVYVLEQPNGASITIDAGRVIGEIPRRMLRSLSGGLASLRQGRGFLLTLE